jgi:sugar lactone lactonase YvrE
MTSLWTALPTPPSLLGESPLWHPREQVLYWTDIPGRCLHRWDPHALSHRQWTVPGETGCLAAVEHGLLLAMREGLARFDPASGLCEVLLAPPYDPAIQRFNDGKVDTHGRWWIGTLHEPRDRPLATLYRLEADGLHAVASDCTVSNGLAFSPQGNTLYWADTTSHRVFQWALDAQGLPLGERQLLRAWPLRAPDQALQGYAGRPDGAAVDVQGCYWTALFEGRQLVRLSPAGEIVQSLPLPVQCATMPCFGGEDLRTLYVTTARHNRPAAELAADPLAGCVLQTRVEVPGCPVPMVSAAHLPAPFVRGGPAA